MKKLKIGVVGVGRGELMARYCAASEKTELVAICDNYEMKLNAVREKFSDKIAYYTSYDEFLNHDMDVVILANFANEHAPFAIKALRAGRNVMSEVLPVQNVAEAIELIETVEETGLKYVYLENYCYMPAPKEMRKLYKEGIIGELEFAEGEYIHNCEPVWYELTYGSPDHWRNNVFSTFYCTHSIGPLLHITGLKPVEVTGFETPFNEMMFRMGRKLAPCGIEMIRLNNGAVIRSVHGDLYKNSIWYSLYGSKGRMESAREDADAGDLGRIYINVDKVPADYGNPNNTIRKNYEIKDEMDEAAKNFVHLGSDYYAMWNAVEYMLGNPSADVIDVYEALDMSLPGIFAYQSILNGGVTVQIPDFRDINVRNRYRNDVRCTDKKIAGDQLLPTCSNPIPEIPDEVYQLHRKRWLKSIEK